MLARMDSLLFIRQIFRVKMTELVKCDKDLELKWSLFHCVQMKCSCSLPIAWVCISSTFFQVTNTLKKNIYI